MAEIAVGRVISGTREISRDALMERAACAATGLGELGVTLLALARPLVDIHPALLLGSVAVLAAELRGVHPIILIGAATLLGGITGFYIL